MGNNLTGQLIKDTYEQLVQISGSILTDGTGSNITSLTVTASFASQAGTAGFTPFATSASFSTFAGTSGFANTAGDAATAISASYALTASFAISSSADNQTLQDVTDNGNVTDNFISSSAGFIRKPTSTTGAYVQIGGLEDNPGNIYFESERDGVDQIRFTSSATTNALLFNVSGSQTARVDFNNSDGEIEAEGNLTLDTRNLGDVIIPSGSLVIANSNEILSDTYKPSGSSAIYFTNNDIGNPTGLNESGLILTGSASIDVDGANNILLTATKDTFKVPVEFEQDITASNATFNNITAVSASIGYLEAITGSAKIIGDAFIILNNDTPTERYAGIIVQDSGSTNTTASFEFDGLTNDWFYEYTDDGGATTDYGVAIFGPEYNTKGSPTYLTANRIPKSSGSHHLNDSNISDDGTTVSINSNTEITGSLIVSGGITGLVDSASFASQAGTAGFATTATSASFASQAGSSGFATSASFATTSSYADNALSASYAVTASFALNAAGGGFPYTGSAEISGSLRVLVDGTADGYTITSGSLTGSLIDNLGTPTSSEAIKHLVYLSQAEYNALTPDSNTMYVISGSGDVVENLIVSSSLEVSGSTILSGSLAVTGASTLPSIVGPTAITGSLIISGSTTITGSLVGNVTALSISSNTASMDLNRGNFFTLQLVSGSNTFINPSNIKAGQTINLLLSTTGSATVSFPSSVKQVSGSSYVPTTTTSKDVVTFISFDNTDLYLSNVKNLV